MFRLEPRIKSLALCGRHRNNRNNNNNRDNLFVGRSLGKRSGRNECLAFQRSPVVLFATRVFFSLYDGHVEINGLAGDGGGNIKKKPRPRGDGERAGDEYGRRSRRRLVLRERSVRLDARTPPQRDGAARGKIKDRPKQPLIGIYVKVFAARQVAGSGGARKIGS